MTHLLEHMAKLDVLLQLVIRLVVIIFTSVRSSHFYSPWVGVGFSPPHPELPICQGEKRVMNEQSAFICLLCTQLEAIVSEVGTVQVLIQ